jgi:hypothetical protein
MSLFSVYLNLLDKTIYFYYKLSIVYGDRYSEICDKLRINTSNSIKFGSILATASKPNKILIFIINAKIETLKNFFIRNPLKN